MRNRGLSRGSGKFRREEAEPPSVFRTRDSLRGPAGACDPYDPIRSCRSARVALQSVPLAMPTQAGITSRVRSNLTFLSSSTLTS